MRAFLHYGITTQIGRVRSDEVYIGLQHRGEEGQVYRFRELRVKETPAVK